MKTNLGNPQRIQFATYLDCKRRTKKQIDFPSDEKGHKSDDEKMVRFLLANSSITEHEGERAFQRVSDAIDVICRQAAGDAEQPRGTDGKFQRKAS